MMDTFTLLIDGAALEGPARMVDGRAHLVPSGVWDALGGTLTGETDLEEVAARLDRVLVVDLDERAAFLGTSARARAAALASLQAPDFTLADLDGRTHSLAAQRGKKVFVVAWGSW
jgi:hypothetical protein